MNKVLLTSLELNWTLPSGLVDYFSIICVNLNQSDSDFSINEKNSTNKSKCEDLMPLSTYKIKVSSVRLVDNVPYETSTTIYAKTGKCS